MSVNNENIKSYIKFCFFDNFINSCALGNMLIDKHLKIESSFLDIILSIPLWPFFCCCCLSLGGFVSVRVLFVGFFLIFLEHLLLVFCWKTQVQTWQCYTSDAWDLSIRTFPQAKFRQLTFLKHVGKHQKSTSVLQFFSKAVNCKTIRKTV